jgi:hypothetical protein
MHPVRRVGQALDAVEVGHVVAVGLGELGAEVGIALPPDDQSRRRDRKKLCGGFLLGLSHRGAVVVDHPGRCPWLRPRLFVAFDFLRRVRRVRVLQEVPEEVPVSGVHHVLGQSRCREEEEVPGLPELVRVVQSLREPPRMSRVEDGESVDHLGVVHRGRPGDGPAPVVTDQQRGLLAELSDEAADVVGEQVDPVRLEAVWLRGQVVATSVGGDDPKTGRRKRRDLQPPTEPELREAVQQNDQRAVTSLDVMQALTANLGVTLPKLDPNVREHAGSGHEDLLGRGTCARRRYASRRCRASPRPDEVGPGRSCSSV